jgi:1-aminocyclopropane-1-carboxylate deaminase
LDFLKRGIIKKGENVIFIFTGGSPAVFAYNEELSKKNS